MRTLTFTRKAWFTSPTQLDRLRKNDPSDPPTVELYDNDMSEHGWINAGTAEVTVTLPLEVDMVKQTVTQLNAAIQKVKAEAFEKCSGLEAAINNLLSLTYEAPVQQEEPLIGVLPDDPGAAPNDPDDDDPF